MEYETSAAAGPQLRKYSQSVELRLRKRPVEGRRLGKRDARTDRHRWHAATCAAAVRFVDHRQFFVVIYIVMAGTFLAFLSAYLCGVSADSLPLPVECHCCGRQCVRGLAPPRRCAPPRDGASACLRSRGVRAPLAERLSRQRTTPGPNKRCSSRGAPLRSFSDPSLLTGAR